MQLELDPVMVGLTVGGSILPETTALPITYWPERFQPPSRYVVSLSSPMQQPLSPWLWLCALCDPIKQSVIHTFVRHRGTCSPFAILTYITVLIPWFSLSTILAVASSPSGFPSPFDRHPHATSPERSERPQDPSLPQHSSYGRDVQSVC